MGKGTESIEARCPSFSYEEHSQDAHVQDQSVKKVDCKFGASDSDSEDNDNRTARPVRLRRGNKKKRPGRGGKRAIEGRGREMHAEALLPSANMTVVDKKLPSKPKEKLNYLSVFFSRDGRGTAYSFVEAQQQMSKFGLYRTLVRMKKGQLTSWAMSEDVHALALVVSCLRDSISTRSQRYTRINTRTSLRLPATLPRSLG